MTRTLDLLRNHLWNMQAVITESGDRGFVYFYVRIEPIDGPFHGTEKTTAHRTKNKPYEHARTVLGMDEPGTPASTTLADLEADSEDRFKNPTDMEIRHPPRGARLTRAVLTPPPSSKSRDRTNDRNNLPC